MQAPRTDWTAREAIGRVYASYNRAKPRIVRTYDRDVRHPEWTSRLLDYFGRPDRSAYSIALTGSKGKGSHAILLAAILQQCGLRTGLFTGPHLVDFMERFRVDGQVMPEPRFIAYMGQVWPVVEQLPIPPDQYIGPVGILAAVAGLWFRDMGTQVNVIECGRGALHDDVNQWTHQGAVVTPVFLEHVRQLGPTLRDIAIEKAGIVTAETRWVCAQDQPHEVAAVFMQACTRHGARWRTPGSAYTFTVSPEPAAQSIRVEVRDGGTRFTVLLPGDVDFLALNAVVALDAARQAWRDLREEQRFPETVDLRRIRLPGRMQRLLEQPLTIVDGTIHRSSAQQVARWIERNRVTGRIRSAGVILGLPDDKDGSGILAALAGHADWLILSRARNPHLVFDRGWLAEARQHFEDVQVAEDIEAAWRIASSRARSQDAVLILGTQSFVGDTLQHFHADTTSIWR